MLLEYGWHMIRSITKIHLRVIELSKWACLATRKEENYKFISKQVLLIDKHKHVKRGIPGSSEKTASYSNNQKKLYCH